MNKLIEIFQSRIKYADLSFKRYLWDEINFKNRLIALTGARGVGKTTLLLQYIKQNLSDKIEDTIYISLDNLYFTKTTLYHFTENFVKQGGKYMFIDEVHKYPDWSIEIKNIYDNYPELKIVLTGSSAINIFKGQGDLSRRIIAYKMNGLSFREFLLLKYGKKFPTYTLKQILNDANEITSYINTEIRPLKYFNEYLKLGYYPYFQEDEQGYHKRIEQTVNEIIETDMPVIEQISYTAVYNIRKLLAILSEIVPYKPNILRLSKQIGINRDTLLKYLSWLERAELLLLLKTNTYGISKLNKPEKIYLNNTNLLYALTETTPNTGTLRETFFYNQLNVKHKIRYTDKGDFIVDDKIIFEIGGKNKTTKQIAGLNNAYIAADNIEYAYKNFIPVWLFGFLY